jgi:hypothetical protein
VVHRLHVVKLPPAYSLVWAAVEAVRELGGSRSIEEINEAVARLRGLTEEQQLVPNGGGIEAKWSTASPGLEASGRIWGCCSTVSAASGHSLTSASPCERRTSTGLTGNASAALRGPLALVGGHIQVYRSSMITSAGVSGPVVEQTGRRFCLVASVGEAMLCY